MAADGLGSDAVEWTVLRACMFRHEALLLVGMLGSSGIEARLAGDDIGGIHPVLPLGQGGVLVLVREPDLNTATELLQGIEAAVADDPAGADDAEGEEE